MATVPEVVPADWPASVLRLPGADMPAWDSAFLESRLSGPPGEVDFLAGVAAAAGPLAPGPWRAGPVAEAWQAGGVLAESPILWLEWDRARGWEAPLTWIGLSAAPLGGAGLGTERSLALVASSVPFLVEGEPEPWRAAVEACVRALPDGAELLHAGSLAPRGISRLRLSFAVHAAEVASWLTRIGWPGATGPVARVLFALAAPHERVGVQIELGPAVGPYLGLEGREYRDPIHARRSVPGFVAELRAFAPLDRDPTEALCAWAGADEDGVRHGYVKAVRGGRGWTAKLYLGFTRAWG